MKRMLFIILVVAFSTNLASPLFPLYGAHYDLSTAAITALFAVYAAGVLAMLLIGGTLAERFGSLRVAAAGVALALASALLFAFARTSLELFLGRLVGGLGVGTFMGTSNSLLLKMTPPARRARIMSFSSILNLAGFGLGPAIGGLWITLLPADAMQAPFFLLVSALIAALALLVSLPVEREEKGAAEPFAIRLGVPAEGRRVFWGMAAPTIFVGFGFGGIAFSLLPGVAAHLFGAGAKGVGGLLVFLMTTTGALFQLLKGPAKTRARLLSGLAMLVAGTWSVVTAEASGLPFAILAGTVLQGAGAGWSFQTSLRLAAEVAVVGDRIRVMSTYFLSAYLGLSLPALLTGALAQRMGIVPAITVTTALLTLVIAATTARGHRALVARPELAGET